LHASGFSVFSTSLATFAVSGCVVGDRDLLRFISLATYAAIAGPCWSSRPSEDVLETLLGHLGFVTDPEIIGIPAWL
jgi:hypothetical protein